MKFGDRERHYGGPHTDEHHTARHHSVRDRLSYRDYVMAKYRTDKGLVQREQLKDPDSDDSNDPRVRHKPKKIKI